MWKEWHKPFCLIAFRTSNFMPGFSLSFLSRNSKSPWTCHLCCAKKIYDYPLFFMQTSCRRAHLQKVIKGSIVSWQRELLVDPSCCRAVTGQEWKCLLQTQQPSGNPFTPFISSFESSGPLWWTEVFGGKDRDKRNTTWGMRVCGWLSCDL